MSKFLTKKVNSTALILSNFHSTFEASIQGLSHVEPQRNLIIKDDPISSHHVLVQDKILANHFIRIEKKDIEYANQNRQELYHLLSTVLDNIKTA